MKNIFVGLLFLMLLITACDKADVPVEPLSHDSFDTLLVKHVNVNGDVNYADFKNDEMVLSTYLDLLKQHEPQDSWSDNKKMAYWINVYNAFTIYNILLEYPVSSIMDIESGAIWTTRTINIGGTNYTLDQIENDKLLSAFSEPRVHFAVNCAAASCPPLLNKAWTEAENKSGYVLINRKDYAIVEMEITSTKNKFDKTYNKSNWKFQNGTYKVQYEKFDGKYYCKRSSKYYNHYVLNEFTDNVEYIVEEYFDWWSDIDDIIYIGKQNSSPNLTDVSKDNNGNITRSEIKIFKPLTNLYSQEYKYDKWWNNWIKPKLSQKIIDDLNSFMDLEKQYEDD